MPEESYTQDDVQQILQLAIARQSPDGGEFSRPQLLEMASDLGISQENLQIAEQQWLSRQGEFKERQLFDDYRRTTLKQNFIRYIIVNSFLILLNLVIFKSADLSLSIALLWGLGLALKTWQTYETNEEKYQQAFQKWRLRKQIGQSITTAVDKLINPR